MNQTRTVLATLSQTLEKNVDHKSIEQRLFMQYEIARVLAEANSISDAAKQVLQMICETYGWDFGGLWIIEPETRKLINEGLWHVDDVNFSHDADGVDQTSFASYVVEHPQLLWLSGLDEIHFAGARNAEKAGFKSGFVLPIINDDKVIAILECLSRSLQTQNQDQVEMLNALSSQFALFLDRQLLGESLAIQVRQQQMLAQIGMALSTSLDYKERLANFMSLVVPELADWCAVDTVDSESVLERVGAAHVDSKEIPLIYELQPRRVLDLSRIEEQPQVTAFLSGQSLLFKDITPSLIEEMNRDNPERREKVYHLNPTSSVIVPLLARGRILGACTFVRIGSREGYVEKDLPWIDDIGRRLALDLDNANLYAESQKTNAELERRMEERTAQLKLAINQLTNQISEREHAEEQVKILNAELGHRIQERTFELEVANHNLQKEVQEHQKASLSLRELLKRTRELYHISQAIGTVREPNEVLRVLLSSRYLKHISRASIAIMEKPWLENGPAPEYAVILAEWNKGMSHPRYLNRRFTLEEMGVLFPVSFGKPIIIQDILSITSLSESARRRFADMGTHGLIILPLIAGGEWYGLLSLHFRTHWMTNLDDLRHVRGLVDETAIAIKNMRLLETEAKARREAEAANQLKLKFLAMISHELRTPLASIKGFATTLIADDVEWEPERQRDFLQTIDSEADKLTELIEQLLDLSRIEAGNLRIMPQKQSFQNVVAAALTQIQTLTSEHALVFNIPSNLPAVNVDKQRIAQVMTNLVGNAVKFSPQHTQITISVHQIDDSLVQVDVSDQGIGIPFEKRTRIFEAFQQLENEPSIHNKGAGLGLAICRGLIEAHGGNIWIQDRSGLGSTISFTLPIAQGNGK
jgi:signal transduction histidine kinase/putative methionine-R-sulfoxide reductase with GAF domain